jgi:DNA repair protein RadC
VREILNIKVVDHIIVADDQHLSFAERKIGGL